jgi:hypothetical protein
MADKLIKPRPGETLNARFCRILLQQALLDLTGRELAHYRKHAAVLRMSGFNGFWFFEWSDNAANGGGNFSCEVQADNAAHARALGVAKWLEYHAEAKRCQNWPREKDE